MNRLIFQMRARKSDSKSPSIDLRVARLFSPFMTRITLALALVFGSVPGAFAESSQKTAASIYKENIDRIFTIHAGNNLGTGFVIATGRVATNAHVVGDKPRVEVEAQNGARYKATVVVKDVNRDFAILEFEGIRPFVSVVSLQKRPGALEIGEGVVVIGSPLGLKGTVTTGIVSQFLSNGMIQLNASINPGNSGGPVFDMQGRIVGIATQKLAETLDGKSVDGIGAAIPIDWLEGR